MKNISLAVFFTISLCFSGLAQESKPLEILEKPALRLTKEQEKTRPHLQGTITLRVTFLANGQVGEVVSVSKLPFGLTETAIEAAKKIKFQPKIDNVIPVNTTKQVQYAFLYGFWEPSVNNVKNNDDSKTDEKAEAIFKQAIEKLGGEKYLNAKSQIGRGKFSVIQNGAVVSFQSFVDILVFPDKERTEFKSGGAKTIQTNTGETGWIFDGDAEMFKEQDAQQVANFKRGIRTSLDNLLRGNWRKDGTLTYIGKRPATLGRRNEVVKLTYTDGLTIEFEFSDEFMPVKAIYKRTNADGEEIKEEDRYAQFVDVNGIKTPFIIDRFSNGTQSSRINYETVEYNKNIPDSVFAKPRSVKEAKKDLKF